MDNFFKWYGICTNRTNICEYEDNKKCVSLYPGELIKISQQTMPHKKELHLIVLFKQQTPDDYKGETEKIFLCSNTNFEEVNDNFWPYLIVESNNFNRLNVFRKQQEILSLKVGEMINIYTNSRQHGREFKICCKIEFIGEVPEYGKGVNFCLRAMTNFEFVKSPQTNFIGKYAKGPRTSLIILTSSSLFGVIENDDIINRPVVLNAPMSSKNIPRNNEIEVLEAQLTNLKQRLGVGNTGNIQVPKNTGAIRKNSFEKIRQFGGAIRKDSLEKIKQPQKISLRFNTVSMTCSICRKDCPVSSGILLANCGHIFCYDCLTSHINSALDHMKICPFINKTYRCNSIIQMDEIVSLNSEGTKILMGKNRNNHTDSGLRPVNTSTSWGCSECTFENNLNATKCNMCNAERVRQPVDCIQCMNCFDTCSQGTIFTIPECNHNVCNNCLMVYLEHQLKDDVDNINCTIKFCDYILKTQDILDMFIVLDRFFIKNGMNFFDVCVACQVSHSKISCKQFQKDLKLKTDLIGERLRNKYDQLFDIGDAVYCPKCQLMIVRQGHEKEYCFNCEEVFKPDYQGNPWQCGICFSSNNRSSNFCGVCGKIPKNKVVNKTATVSCMFCTLVIKFNEGVTLSCSHFFCKACLEFLVNSNESVLKCPFQQNNETCSTTIEQYEILQIVGAQMYKRHKIRLAREVAKQTENSVLCLDENCTGWTFKEDLNDSNMFICTVCREPNCLVCKVVHAGMTCAVYNDLEKREEFLKPKPQQYHDLLKMDDDPIIKNPEPFECPICVNYYEIGEAVLLRECLHVICRQCLTEHVKHGDSVEATCTYVDNNYKCDSIIQEREIRAVVDEQTYNKYMERQYTIGKNNIENGFQCQTVNCIGFWENDGNINEQECPLCKAINCLNCKAIHPDMKCDEYQSSNETKKKLEEEIARGEGMRCPKCKIIIVRISGCDWLQCAMCRTEICWVTKGARWGPNGHGDSSGGCKCRVNGQKCHPNCMNCH